MNVVENLTDRYLTRSQRKTLSRYWEFIRDAVSTITNYPTATVGLAIIATFVILAIFAPIIATHDPQQAIHAADGTPKSLEEPSTENFFGTTHFGYDVFSQWVYGSRVSLIVGFLSGFAILFIGGSVGLISGYYKGRTDMVLMRIVDVLYGIPTEPLILVLALFFGGSIWVIIAAFAMVLWRSMARIVRAQTLSVSERPYVKAARASGASDLRIIYLHIAPNILPLMLIQTTLIIGWAIVVEAGISFLGYGAQDMVSWGTMLQLTFTTGAIREAWWWMIPPGISITLIVMSFFYVTRAIEDITNPEVRR